MTIYLHALSWYVCAVHELPYVCHSTLLHNCRMCQLNMYKNILQVYSKIYVTLITFAILVNLLSHAYNDAFNFAI